MRLLNAVRNAEEAPGVMRLSKPGWILPDAEGRMLWSASGQDVKFFGIYLGVTSWCSTPRWMSRRFCQGRECIRNRFYHPHLSPSTLSVRIMKFASTAAVWAAALLPLAASSATRGMAVRNTAGISAHDTVLRVARALHLMSREDHTVFENSTDISRSYEDAILLKIEGPVDFQTKKGNGTVTAGIEVVCAKCYITTKATASLTIEQSDIDWSATIGNFSEAVVDEFHNLTDVTIDWIHETAGSAWEAFVSVLDFDDDTSPKDVEFPTLDVDFNIDLPTDLLPETNLKIKFDELEVYLEMDLTINAGVVYTIPLLPPQAHPIGLAKSSDLFIGTVLALELILSAAGEVELTTGLHILLDDEATLEIELFGQNISNTKFPGGKVEFLPVTVRSGQVTLSAILKISVHTGFSLDIPNVPDFLEAFLPAAGIEASMFANLAEFTTNISFENEDEDEDGCLFEVEQDFRFAVGAAAGATIQLAGETWGPDPNTTINLWSTKIDVCGKSAPVDAPTTTTQAAQDKRQEDGLSTATFKSTLQYTGVVCLSSLAQCPASLQKHTIVTSVTTLTSILPSGATPTWPTTAADAIRSKVKFGSQVKALFAASGTPTPGMGNDADDDDILDKAADLINGVDKRLIIGLSVGIGGAALVALGVIIALCVRKRSHHAVPEVKEPMIDQSGPAGPMDSSYYGAGYGTGGYGAPLPSPGIASPAKVEPEVSYHARS
jgi:hypothetical protein